MQATLMVPGERPPIPLPRRPRNHDAIVVMVSGEWAPTPLPRAPRYIAGGTGEISMTQLVIDNQGQRQGVNAINGEPTWQHLSHIINQVANDLTAVAESVDIMMRKRGLVTWGSVWRQLPHILNQTANVLTTMSGDLAPRMTNTVGATTGEFQQVDLQRMSQLLSQVLLQTVPLLTTIHAEMKEQAALEQNCKTEINTGEIWNSENYGEGKQQCVVQGSSFENRKEEGVENPEEDQIPKYDKEQQLDGGGLSTALIPAIIVNATAGGVQPQPAARVSCCQKMEEGCQDSSADQVSKHCKEQQLDGADLRTAGSLEKIATATAGGVPPQRAARAYSKTKGKKIRGIAAARRKGGIKPKTLWILKRQALEENRNKSRAFRRRGEEKLQLYQRYVASTAPRYELLRKSVRWRRTLQQI